MEHRRRRDPVEEVDQARQEVGGLVEVAPVPGRGDLDQGHAGLAQQGERTLAGAARRR